MLWGPREEPPCAVTVMGWAGLLSDLLLALSAERRDRQGLC